MSTAIVAFGGNALVTDAEHDSIPQQYETVSRTVPPLIDMVEQGWKLVVSHGNGPQVGFILRRSELAEDEVDPVPVDYAVADTQGAIGYMFQRALYNEFKRRGLPRETINALRAAFRAIFYGHDGSIQNRARALDNNFFVVAPNMGTYYLDAAADLPIDTFGGRSMIVDYKGRIVGRHDYGAGSSYVAGTIDIEAMIIFGIGHGGLQNFFHLVRDAAFFKA